MSPLLFPDPESLLSRSHCYTGIGSRSAPPHILLWIERIAACLARQGKTLRSGGAPGSDAAFERGCDLANGAKEIYLPWRGFQENPSLYFDPPAAAIELAARHHPNPSAWKQGAHKLHGRNSQQVLGANLQSPTGFVLFYAEERSGRIKGGTATAVSIAREAGIDVINLFLPEVLAVWQTYARADELSRLTFWRRLFGGCEKVGG